MVGDDKSDIINGIESLLKVSEILIITGGLGPTHDDITKAVIAEYFDSKLELNKELLNKIEKNILARGFKVSDKIKIMAMVPDKCEILENNVGQGSGHAI